jgi:hypothetical protein
MGIVTAPGATTVQALHNLSASRYVCREKQREGILPVTPAEKQGKRSPRRMTVARHRCGLYSVSFSDPTWMIACIQGWIQHMK